MNTININEIKNLNLDLVIDIREVDEYKQLSIPGVKNIPMQGLLLNAENFLNKNETYYLMCASGNRSAMTCTQLNAKGYNVVNLAGGISSYEF